MAAASGRDAAGEPASGRFRPARLVFLLQDLKFGGTQRQTLELAHRLDPDRYQVELWLLAGGDDLTPLARSQNLEPLWLSRREKVHPAALLKLWRRLYRQPPDLLMTLTVVPNIWGRLLGRLARVQVIVGNCRGGGAPRRQHEAWLWPLADHLLCNSQALKSRLTNGYRIPLARISVIGNGVDTEFFKPTPDAPPGQVVLSVGRFVPDKDPETLLRAFHRLAPEYPQAELWLVGEGPLLPVVRELANNIDPSGRVRFLPPQADLRPLLRQASVFALSSRAEALPNVILEAMAAGTPVVATNVGGLPELVNPEETGLLVPPENAAALAAALGRLLADPEYRAALGRAGRERAVRNFSLEAMVRRHEQIFQALLSSRKNSGPAG